MHATIKGDQQFKPDRILQRKRVLEDEVPVKTRAFLIAKMNIMCLKKKI